MVGEVNNLIYNVLTANTAVNLPGIGTLCITRKPARLAARDMVEPPQYTVEYSSHVAATSIVDVIASAANIDAQKAQDIYDRWLDKTFVDGYLRIDGVGELRGKSFVADSQLVSALNTLPQIKQFRRSNTATMIWYFLAFVMVGVCIFSVYYVLSDKDVVSESDVVDNRVEESELQEIILKDNIDIKQEDIVAEPTTEPLDADDEIIAEKIVYDWRADESVKHRVIVGSYSTEENARRAVSDIEERMSDIKCSVFKLGSMYAVAIFGSLDKSECERFIRDYVKEFNQAWIHTPRKFRE